ncbi:GH36-type glycosyl hydrolase domain-containing protein [Alkalibacterium sp. f15]|uniref:GH36-type glycosyl hydrolase domain-containing protein n=1 Tax=Alkalibacterium sp. f15 TaxID=3414029 RepID=UPI003BF91D40
MIEVNTEMKNTHVLKKKDTEFVFLPTGDILKASAHGVMLNQVLGNTLDGSMNNLFLRMHEGSEITYAPMLGIASDSKFSIGEESVRWQGTFKEVDYTVTFQLGEENTWFWTVDLTGQDKTVDVVYGWDLGLNYQGALQSNEGYVAQYVGHSVFDEENGFVVCSRQNQAEEVFPYIQQGGLTNMVGYSTDGFQFFGKSYKETDKIERLSKTELENKVYQYEFDYTALQSEKVELNGTQAFVFYGLYKHTHPKAITEVEYQDDVQSSWNKLVKNADYRDVPKISLSPAIGEPLPVESMTQAELEQAYPDRLQEEMIEEKLVSFFTEDYSHITLKEKEIELERQQGHIIYTKNELTVDEPIISTTSWIAGVFNSQIVLGNTSMNKFITNTRNHLNILKAQGQRIYVKTDEQYHLLTMPSLFEMGFNYVKWVYKTADETFNVTNFTDSQTHTIKLTVKAASGKNYAYKVTNQVVLHDSECNVPYYYKQEDNLVTFKPSEKSIVKQAYPELTYYMKVEGPTVACSDGASLTTEENGSTSSLFVMDVPATDTFSLIMQGTVEGKAFEPVTLDFETEKEAFKDFYASLMNDLKLEHADKQVSSEVEKMNLTLWWYTHDMFVHYLVPHGLEQYGGAAWGTRDIAQGPAEYFLAMKQYDVVKDIIFKLFSHQFVEDGSWPQWFMFDKYTSIHSDESHGDIIVWPMKLLGDYLTATQDYAILNEELPYLSRETKALTDETEPLLKHLHMELDYITTHFLEGTTLSSYGDGDWDDTLQPFNQKLKKYMASSWTVALTYQALNTLARGIEKEDKKLHAELAELAQEIKADYEKIIMADDVIPGFIYMEEDETDFMIHPTDTKTGITYRLLPMIRSMISELFDDEQVNTHLDIIKRELTFNDGIRLMNKPAEYKGGVSSNFKRAEQAANFGREIGLLYIHAHIRYVEAMAKIGKADETWDNLLKINPINIKDHVPNAQIRQSNAYFSSSDAAFDDRYEAQNNYDKLRKGEIEVKGGWRVYSSGPGIYLNQLLSNVLGMREDAESVIFDPVIPEHLSGLKVHTQIMNEPATIVFNSDPENRSISVNESAIDTEKNDNIYRTTGWKIAKNDLKSKLNNTSNVILINY